MLHNDAGQLYITAMTNERARHVGGITVAAGTEVLVENLHQGYSVHHKSHTDWSGTHSGPPW